MTLLGITVCFAGNPTSRQSAPIMEKIRIVESDGTVREELPIGFTAEEWARRDEIYNLQRSTDPPPSPIRNIAEYERMQGALIRYPFGIPTELIREMAEDVTVYCLVSSANQSAAASVMSSGGVNMDHVEYILGATDSYWTRDYGPWWVTDGNGNISVVDHTYNRPRPNDNDAPLKVSNYLDVPYFASDIIHTGGNYMTDSFGISASSSLVYEENSSLTAGEILTLMGNYYGIDTYHVLDDPNGDYIEHIDCWGKFLRPDKVLIREVPEYHSQYDEIAAVVDYFEAQNSAYGSPYEIVRVNTPNDEPYTNSLFLNEKVFVPLMDGQTENNAAALEAYQNALPGYEVIGVAEPASGWLSTDALHCRVKGIPDIGMLDILHLPPADQSAPDSLLIQADIHPYSNEPLIADSLRVTWTTPFLDDWQTVGLDQIGTPDGYIAQIPSPPSSISIDYVIHAADSSGRWERYPIAEVLSVRAAGILPLGDVTLDGKIGIADVLALAEHLQDENTLTGHSLNLADINTDGAVDIVDFFLVLDRVMEN